MSLNLVSQSLDLDLGPSKSDLQQKQKSKKKDKEVQNALDHINTNRQGVKKQLRKVEQRQKRTSAEKRKKRKLKSGIEKYQEEKGQDYTQSNLVALKHITDLGKVSRDISEKILYKHPCRLSRDVKQKQKEEEVSLFTEEDFQKFAKEYKPNIR
ncbi:active regulator of SIRT1-like [Elysia marginata]|uniref:Active regulator of SIRT1 n=1 Tax=Elysia marginata TaxID=1093978 RepID=A0AAV4G5R4_9GAST|nr:active regulator of SIRT1-like [Elysia marginata]